MVSVYADESGTHDESGMDDHAMVATIAGFAASREDWLRFSRQWQIVLDKYGRGGKDQGFHATEWAFAYKCSQPGAHVPARYKDSPYCGWSLEKLIRYRQELAKLAGHGNKLHVCGGINVREFAALKKKHPGEFIEYAYAHCMFSFFTELLKEINLWWPHFKEERSIQLIFHQKTDPKWRHAMGQAFMLFKKCDARLDGYFFQPAQFPYLPLQAADMLAHRCREKAIERDKDGISLNINNPFDQALFRKVERNAARLRRQNAKRR